MAGGQHQTAYAATPAAPRIAQSARATANIVRLISPADAACDPALLGAWEALASQASEPNPFLEHWYLLSALAQCDATRRAMLLLIERDGRLIGLMPIHREPRHGRLPLPHWAAWHHPNAFLGTPLVSAGEERGFWEALFGALDGMGGAALFFHLRALHRDGPLAQSLAAFCQQTQRPFGLVHHEQRAMLCKGLGPADYLEAAMRGKKRKELRRQLARLRDEGAVLFERQSDDAGLDGWVAEFLALEKAGWKGKAGSAMTCAPGTRQLFIDGLQGAAQRGRLERLTLRLNGRAIAMLANFIGAPGAFSYKTAFDEDYARFSPGVQLQIENLAMLDNAAIAWCDSCATPDHPMIDSIWMDRRRIGRFSVGIGGGTRRALFRQLLKAEQRRLPPEPQTNSQQMDETA